MPHICATKFFSLIANRLFPMALPERASGLEYSREVNINVYDLILNLFNP
jgi:hypothetical protein